MLLIDSRFRSETSRALARTETSSVAGQNQTVVSKSATKAVAGLVSLEMIRMISRFPSTGELNLDSFAADLDMCGSPGAPSGPGETGRLPD